MKKTFTHIPVLFAALFTLMPLMAQETLTEAIVYERLMSRCLLPQYREGTIWTNSKSYVNTVEFHGYPPGFYTGYGCFGFMMDMMEFCSGYEYPIERIEASYNNLPVIRVGDGIRINNDTHSVVVIKVNNDGHTVTVAEANYNRSVHWGRVINLADPNTGVTAISSFWPNVISGISDYTTAQLHRDVTITSIAGIQMRQVPHTDKPVQEILRGLPKGNYIIRDGSNTYKLFYKGY